MFTIAAILIFVTKAFSGAGRRRSNSFHTLEVIICVWMIKQSLICQTETFRKNNPPSFSSVSLFPFSPFVLEQKWEKVVSDASLQVGCG